ncbi:hypothetical protein GDO86_005672 [Hymenochirus boettgeri]|uniref:Pleckstrin homology domain-containing family G member 7 n=1 Tax=Hymenochirus boettgeri TaxID=247094 RepID=A0A8T2JAB7_9PIPI|nr:hypothetical protein GDO86_005672 [Hymenochirus boettgeri]
MEKPLQTLFSVMNEEVFNTTAYEMKVGNGTICELIDSSSETLTTSNDYKEKEAWMCKDHSKRENTHRRTHNIPPLIVMVPPVEEGGNHNTLFQFDRQAPGRISTSPTLRRIRKNTTGQFLPLQEIFNASKSPNYKEQSPTNSFGHLWDSPPLSPKYRTSISQCSSLSPLISSSEEDKFIVPVAVEKNMRLLERRRSSLVLSLPGLEVFPGDLLVSDGASDYLYYSTVPCTDVKKTKWPFSKKGSYMKGKQKHISDLENCLSTLKISDCTDNELYNLKDKTWSEFISMQAANDKEILYKANRRRQESVWELFTSECTYLLDHLLVLKVVFFSALQYLQSNDHLLDVDLVRLFANLDELKQESFNFAFALLDTIKSKELECATSDSLPLGDLLTEHFKKSLCLSHQIYCLNYTSAVIYLESIRHRDDFAMYLKWCEQHEQCKRLHLSDLLVAPLHRLTRYPLLLKNIWKRSSDATEKMTVYSMKEKVESSIRDLEGNVKWLDKSQKYKQLQEVIVWPSLWERDKRFFIPEGLKHCFKETNVETLLSSPNRDLLFEGRMIMTESARLLDVYLFLFDDFLLITKVKHNKRKSANLESNQFPSLHPELQTVMKEGGYCKVVDQPIPLDRLTLKTIDQYHVTVYGLKNAFLIQHENRYQQCVAAFILHAQTESDKKAWMSQIETAVSCYAEAHKSKHVSAMWQTSESTEI